MKIIQSPTIHWIKYPISEYISECKSDIEALIAFALGNVSLKKEVNIFCMGSSGAILATFLFLALEKKHKVLIIHVKKDGEISHGANVSSFNQSASHIFIDDFIDTGNTLEICLKKVRRSAGNNTFKFNYIITGSSCKGYTLKDDFEGAETWIVAAPR